MTRLPTRLLPLVMLLLCGGCEVLGLVAARGAPEPTTPAAYELKVVPTAVTLVADEATLGADLALSADPAAMALRRGLAEHTEVPLVGRPAELAAGPVTYDAAAQQTRPAVQTVELTIEPMASADFLARTGTRVKASGRVRVLDGSGRELWPLDTTPGKKVTAELPLSSGDGAAGGRAAALRALGAEAARLFYDAPVR